MKCVLKRLKSLEKDKKKSKMCLLLVWQNVSLYWNLFLIVKQYDITIFFLRKQAELIVVP